MIYCDVIDRLERDAVRYVVISGVAVVLHGYTRPVSDLDIVISNDPENESRAMRSLTLAGFTATIPLPLSMLTVMRMLDSSNREIDVFVHFIIPFEELWASSLLIDADGTLVRVMSLEHLIQEKRCRARSYDLKDVEILTALNKQS